jgi:hypothetical protein
MMKQFFLICFFALLSLPAIAADNGRVIYNGGTARNFTGGTPGKLDTNSETALIFTSASSKLEIPYAAIQSYEYSKEVKRHLGVLPAIAIGLVKIRQRNHFFRISYRDTSRNPNGSPTEVNQVVIFEVPKHLPRTLHAILDARAPHASALGPLSVCRN